MSIQLLYQTIQYPHHSCLCECSGESVNVLVVATQLVMDTLCSAQSYIENDVAEVFYYKYPLNFKHSESDSETYESSNSTSDSFENTIPNTPNEKTYFDYNDDLSWISRSIITNAYRDDARHPNDIEWCTIEQFNLRDVGSQIRDYIELWHLMPGTKCALVTKDEIKKIKNKGFRYYVDALFSNPTPQCPNPLAVAKVNFYIHIPELMPKYYPVMVTYRFEGFKSIYHALGHRQMRSLEFQRFFIDTILHMKLNFYAQIYECRFSTDEKSTDHAEEEINAESEIVCDEGLEEDFLSIEEEKE